jgi:hypothetical protein
MKSAHHPLILSILFIGGGRALATDCSVSGEVFAVDPVAQTILVRNEGGYLKLVDVDTRTSFTSSIQRERVTPNLQNIDSGDLVCVEFRADRPQLAERVVDVPRIELQRKQREWLTTWQKSLVRGKIEQVLAHPDRLVLDTSGAKVQVAVLPNTSIRWYPATAKALEDGRESSFSQLRPGMSVSLRVSTDPPTGAITARSVYTGGVTSVAGVLTGVKVLEETVSIRELGTGRTIDIKLPASRLYQALTPSLKSPEPNAAASVLGAHHKLRDIGFADLQAGDWVLVTGMPGNDATTMTGFAVITRFGYFDSETQTLDPVPRL